MAVATEIIKIDPGRVEKDQLRTMVSVLQRGGIMAYPTDTFYGLGANCFLTQAVQRIYALKKRKPSKPLAVLVSERDTVRILAREIPPLFWELTERFWPGPLTLVLRASSELPGEMLGPGESVGIRMPDLSWLQDMISQAGSPITATSANISGEKEIEDPERVKDVFSGKVDLIVDGGQTEGILPSTVVDLSSQKPLILREGAVLRSMLAEYLEGNS